MTAATAEPESQARPERSEGVPPTHFPDALRIGVLAGEEGDELRLAAHFMHCEFCREPALRLLEKIAASPQGQTPAVQISCAEARNALLRYFEQGRELTQTEIDHLNTCLGNWREHFLEPARCAHYDELEDDIPALD